MSWSSPADLPLSESPREDVWTVQKVVQWSTGWVKEKGVDKDASSPRLEAELLLAHVLQCDRMRLYLQLDRPLSKEERDTFKNLLKRRVDGEPISQILGYRDFFRHRFKVTKDVLTPRPDTEILVEQALAFLADKPQAQVLDVGTGSGCIAISLALDVPGSSVEAWDVSSDALNVAGENARELNAGRVAFVQKDIFVADADHRYDLVVSNPPYIRRGDERSLSVSVSKFEPSLALFDDHAVDGLSFYRVLAKRATTWLRPGGALIVECGCDQTEAVSEIFGSHGLKKLTITKDLAGLPRVVSGEWHSAEVAGA